MEGIFCLVGCSNVLARCGIFAIFSELPCALGHGIYAVVLKG
jgi:hypothetical protein